MRIAYDVAPLKFPRTGVGHYAAALLEHLIEVEPDLEFNFFSLTARQGSGFDFPAAVAGRAYMNGKGAGRLYKLASRIPRSARRVALTAWTMAGRPSAERFIGRSEVVHGTNFWVPPLAARNGVVTIHDLSFWIYPEFCTPPVRRYRTTMPRILDRCQIVITPSQTVKSETADAFKFPADRIVVTPEGVRGAFVGAEPDPQLAAKIGVTKQYVLCAGTQEPRKNLDRLIEAMSLLRDLDLQLVIAGPPGWGSVDLPAVARKHGVEDRVLFSGYLEDSKLGALMASAAVFAYPSIYEGFGLPPLEAMAAGVPVVAGAAGALPETLGEAAVWCNPRETSSIADAIRLAVTDETIRSSSIEKGKTQSRLYDWHETARLTLAAYRAVAS